MQYPQIRPLGRQPQRALFRHQMHWTTRVMLVLASFFAIVIGLGVLSALGLLVWAAITA